MVGDRLPGTILCQQLISNLSAPLAEALKLPEGHRAVEILTCDSDDLCIWRWTRPPRRPTWPWPMPGASMPARPTPPRLWPGRQFVSSQGAPRRRWSAAFLRRGGFGGRRGLCVGLGERRCGVSRPLRQQRGDVPGLRGRGGSGEALAYLIAPPAEALVGLDAAMKASDVELCKYFAPPTETNFSGGLLRGTQSACQAACDAFAEAVLAVAAHPKETGGM